MNFRNLFAILPALVSVLSLPVLAAEKDLPSPQGTLTLLNWSEYLDPELIVKFEQAFNAKLSEIYFESDDLRDDMLLENNGSGFDLVMVSGSTLDVYRKRNWMAPLDLEQIPNYQHIDKHWLKTFPAAQRYAAPCFWGTTGIAYRSDLVTAPPTNWMDLLKSDEVMRGRIAMVETSRELMTAALKAQGYMAEKRLARHTGFGERLRATVWKTGSGTNRQYSVGAQQDRPEPA